MTAPTKSSGSFLVTAVVALALVVVAGLLWSGRDDDDTEVAQVVVRFHPPFRGETVNIVVNVDGIDVFREGTQKSPWNREFPVSRDADISVLATQTTGETLDCRLLRNGYPVHATSTIGAGSVRCLSVK